ncbi:hypothetical protein JW964_22285, partial [candidate division KSB1 bacterium]|nr:hypothetical protein [candidate division KSB1 bacterium]
MSNAHIQAKLNQKLKLLQDKKKIVKNLKSLELFEKGVQEEIERITPEKRKFEEWARYFGSEDAKTRQVLKWFNDELKKLNEKADRAHSMRTKILAVQEQIDHQIQHLNIELDQLRTESFRIPQSRTPEPPASIPGYDINIPTTPPFMGQSTVLPDKYEPEPIPDSLLEEVLFRKPGEIKPDPSDKDELSGGQFSEPVQPDISRYDDSIGTKKDEERDSQNWKNYNFEESEPKVSRLQEPPSTFEKFPEESILPDNRSASRNADFLFQDPETDDENQPDFSQKSLERPSTAGVPPGEDLNTDFIDMQPSQKFTEPTINISRNKGDEFPEIEEDTQRDMKHFRLSPQDLRNQTPSFETKKTESRNDFLDDFLQHTSEKAEKRKFQQPIIQNKFVENTSRIPKSTEFDEFEVFEKGLNRQSSTRSVDEHKINYIKNQPIRPVEDVPPPVQAKPQSKMVETRETPAFNSSRPEPAPPVPKPASTQPVKNEQVFRQVVIEKEAITPNPVQPVT